MIGAPLMQLAGQLLDDGIRMQKFRITRIPLVRLRERPDGVLWLAKPEQNFCADQKRRRRFRRVGQRRINLAQSSPVITLQEPQLPKGPVGVGNRGIECNRAPRKILGGRQRGVAHVPSTIHPPGQDAGGGRRCLGKFRVGMNRCF